jgi:hypothetical protein
MNTSLLPIRLLVNAIHWPSGEKRGSSSCAAWVVIRRGFAPFASAIQTSPRYENVTRPSFAT